MKDRYGREYTKEEIINKDMISLIDMRSLDEITDEELSKEAVLITDPNGSKRIYLISELQMWLKASNYCRLVDPLTHVDILHQVPEFKAAINFEQNAPHYNAYILGKYPEFIPMLRTYIEEVLNPKDALAFSDHPKKDIQANKSEKLDKFYQDLADMPDEKREAFFSLFLTNRSLYIQEIDAGNLLTFPAKWEPDQTSKTEMKYYEWAINNNHYKLYPNRNVRAGDFIVNPEEGCMHSWGMDVLYLLLEYHIGSNKPFTLFDSTTNKESFEMEQTLSKRIKKQLTPGSLNPQKGQKVFEKVKEVTLPEKVKEAPLSDFSSSLYTKLTNAIKTFATVIENAFKSIKEFFVGEDKGGPKQ